MPFQNKTIARVPASKNNSGRYYEFSNHEANYPNESGKGKANTNGDKQKWPNVEYALRMQKSSKIRWPVDITRNSKGIMHRHERSKQRPYGRRAAANCLGSASERHRA